MPILRQCLLRLAESKRLYGMISGNELTKRMTRRFVAGEGLDEAVAAVRALNGKGIHASLDLLGENVHTEAEARAAGATYVAIMERIAKEGLQTNASLKLTQMGLDLGQALCIEVTGQVVAKAAELGNFIRIDMEGTAYTERTLQVFEALHDRFPKAVGIVLQAYLRRTADDVERMIQRQARVRLCKGAYLEPPDLAFPDKADVDRHYVACMERLMAHGKYPGLATHDAAIIEHARAFAKREGIAPDRYEFQMLYGIRRDLQEQLVQEGHRMRCYVPYGTQWYPYFMRRLAERPANVWFILNNALKA